MRRLQLQVAHVRKPLLSFSGKEMFSISLPSAVPLLKDHPRCLSRLQASNKISNAKNHKVKQELFACNMIALRAALSNLKDYVSGKPEAMNPWEGRLWLWWPDMEQKM